MKKLALLIALLSLCSCGKAPADNTVVSDDIQEEVAQPTKRVVTVTCTGDVTLATDKNAPQENSFVATVQEKDDYSYFFKNVADIFEEDDLTIVNFEGTLSERGTRQNKEFAFRGDPEYVNILTGVEAATLANNHSSDYGEESLEDTINTLEEAGIAAFSGTDTEVMDVNGVSVGLVGVYGLTEKGREALEPAMEAVKEAGAELIIVNAHWGAEKAATPNDTQTELAHKAIDLGADLVIGHHPHVIQGIEKYKGKYIAYSLGNFCFGGNRNPSDKDAYIFRQTFTLDTDGIVEDDDNILIIPCSISSVSGRNNYQPTPLEGEEKDRVWEKITERTEAIAE